MKEHLTVEELLTSLKHCMGYIGGDSCIGCPNAIPETADRDGFCQCRFKTQDEMIHVLESMLKDQQKETKNAAPDVADQEQQEVVVTVGKAETRVTKDEVFIKVR